MKKPLIFAAVAFSLAAVMAVAASRASRPSAPKIGFAGVAAHTAQQQETPGLYSATPYSGLVLVPKPVDPSFVVVPAASTQLDNCIVSPRVHLELKK